MMNRSLINPKRPSGTGWKRAKWWQCPPRLAALGYPVEPWQHVNGLFVLSAVEVAHDPGEIDLGPEYHLSISMDGGRCSGAHAAWVLEQFALSDAKEDNHVPNGFVRNFWRPVADNLSDYECPASMMLSAGENLMLVAKQMGHADWTMIARVYGKWMPDAQPDAGKKAVAVYGKTATNV